MEAIAALLYNSLMKFHRPSWESRSESRPSDANTPEGLFRGGNFNADINCSDPIARLDIKAELKFT